MWVQRLFRTVFTVDNPLQPGKKTFGSGKEAIIPEGRARKGKSLVTAWGQGRGFGCNDLLNLMPALVALKDADFRTLDRMWRSSSQMGIAAAIFTSKRFNKF